MKRLFYLVIILALSGLIHSCSSNSKADTWSPDQEEKWKEECMEMLRSNDALETETEDFCDCMFEKTAERYTPEEVVNLTEEEERKILEECDYSW